MLFYVKLKKKKTGGRKKMLLATFKVGSYPFFGTMAFMDLEKCNLNSKVHPSPKKMYLTFPEAPPDYLTLSYITLHYLT